MASAGQFADSDGTSAKFRSKISHNLRKIRKTVPPPSNLMRSRTGSVQSTPLRGVSVFA